MVGIRVQRKRIKGYKLESPNGLPIIYVGRPNKWGNPFTLESAVHESAVELIEMKNTGAMPGNEIDSHWIPYSEAIMLQKYETHIRKMIKEKPMEYNIDELRGKNLSCWCPLDKKCHADILLKILNENP
jgi:hypothetical protein